MTYDPSDLNNTTVHINRHAANLFRDFLRSHIQNVYDDPFGAFYEMQDSEVTGDERHDRVAKRASAWVDEMVGVCKQLGLDFLTVVEEEATEFEIDRFKRLVSRASNAA